VCENAIYETSSHIWPFLHEKNLDFLKPPWWYLFFTQYVLSHAFDNTTSQNIGLTDAWTAPTSNLWGTVSLSLRPCLGHLPFNDSKERKIIGWPFKTAAVNFVKKDSVNLSSVIRSSRHINISRKNTKNTTEISTTSIHCHWKLGFVLPGNNQQVWQ